MSPYKNACICGNSFPGNNCAHYLSNWLIQNGKMRAHLPDCYPCSAGRPIRAKEVREHYFEPMFKCTTDEPDRVCFIYCENKHNGVGHVYYGTKNHCLAGTGFYSEATDYFYYVPK